MARILRSVANLIKRSANCVLCVNVYACVYVHACLTARRSPCHISHFNETNSGDTYGFTALESIFLCPSSCRRPCRLFHVYHLVVHCLDRAFPMSPGSANPFVVARWASGIWGYARASCNRGELDANNVTLQNLVYIEIRETCAIVGNNNSIIYLDDS